jgi:type I restriction enzyme S subunit
VDPGDFVMNSMDLLTGGVGIATSSGVTSPDYRVFATRASTRCDDRYLLHVFRTLYANRGFYAWGQGSAQLGRWRLPRKRFNEFPFPVPTLPEQEAIVRFLNHVDRRIRRYIRAKQKLIKLLEEQNQAIIHDAVTRGFDPRVPLKSSGVEWLGDVPEHWEMMPNRAFMRPQRRLVGEASSEYTLLSLTKRGVIQRDMENPAGKFPASFDTYQEVLPGDLVFCLFDIDETPRAVGLSRLHGMVTSAYTRFACDPSVVDWVYLFYLAMDNGKRLKPLYTGLRKVITKSSFLSAKFPLPPESERAQILAAVEAALGVVERGVDTAQQEIDLLREFRTRLIADVVTGKLDVREAAGRLPDEIDEPEPLDEMEVDGETNGTGAEDADDLPKEAEA